MKNKFFTIVPIFFIALFFSDIPFLENQSIKTLSSQSIEDDCLITVDFTFDDPETPCEGCCNQCDCGQAFCATGKNTCRGVQFFGTINGSGTLPSGWAVQWNVSHPRCSTTNGSTLTPTIWFDICQNTSNGGYQTVNVTLVVIPNNGCPPVTKTKSVTYLIC